MLKTVDGCHSEKTLKVPVRSLSLLLTAVGGFQTGRLTLDHQSKSIILWDGGWIRG